MTTANGTLEKKDTFLQHVSLKNYKSIKDVEIDFKPGLNIIIGKNASGKTNFVNGLNTILSFNYDELLDSEFSLKAWFKNDTTEIKATNESQTRDEYLKKIQHGYQMFHKLSLKINNDQIKVEDYDDIENELSKDYPFYPVLIKYGIYYNEKSEFINIPFSFSIINNGRISRALMVENENNRSEFVRNFFHNIYINVFRIYGGEIKIIDDLSDKIISFSEEYLRYINNLIFKYSPIREIRINPDFNLIVDVESQKETVTNFYLEFLIDKNWLTFNLLSDGTKRLFYIISEMLAIHDDFISDLNIILLEEPELGIHPHQLHQLMQFIKEQSQEKQIIITTHSPQVLDVLGPDELDRVIICHNDSKKGTQLSHLTEKEIKKAKKYMQEEAFLSDYWRFSDLEPAS